VVAATADVRAAAQQKQVADGEELRRDDGVEGALDNPGKGDRVDEKKEPSKRTRNPPLGTPVGATARHF